MNLHEIRRLPDGEHRIETGLYLRVQNGGESRKFIFRKRVGGRLITRSLGSTATLTLQQARKMAVVLVGDLVGQKVAQELVQDNLETPMPIASTGTAGNSEHLLRSVYLPAIEARRYSAHWRNAKHAEQWVNTIET